MKGFDPDKFLQENAEEIREAYEKHLVANGIKSYKLTDDDIKEWQGN